MRKSRDRYAIVFGTSIVVITFLLVLDIQSKLNLSGTYFPVPLDSDDIDFPKQHIQSELKSEERVELITDDDESKSMEHSEEIDTFTALKRHFGHHLQKFGQLRQFMGSRSSSLNHDIRNIFDDEKDRFVDLQAALDYTELTNSGRNQIQEQYPTIGHLLSKEATENSTILDKFNYEIKQNELYAKDSETIDALVREMATRNIVKVVEKEGGTQIKMTMQFDNGMLALAKPRRFSREQQTLPNQMFFTDFERHTADIAAFHLDRLLGFRRAFPVVGRLLNMSSEIYNISDTKLRETFFISLQPYKNICFYGTCKRYCDIYHPVCGEHGMLEASFIAYFPVYFGVQHDRIRHPWRKSYSDGQKAIWEHDPQYCKRVKAMPPYNNGRRLFDLIDMAIFDFLSGNMDRHHYETIKLFGENTFTIHYDNGRGFGRPFYDELLNLAPLQSCCMIRESTLATLLRFHNGRPLSQLMIESMASDPLQPVLWTPHLAALDRRIHIILTVLRECIEKHPINDVVFPRDEF